MAYYTQGLISQRRGNASYFYHYDGLGSTKALTDPNQDFQASYKYDAWGNVLQSSGTITNPYLYVGELGYYGDGDSGMYLLTQRWYNPVIGRIVVRDPLGEQDRNGYAFVLNDPVELVDPYGLREKCPTWSELPKKMVKCYFKCLGIEWGPRGPEYYIDLSCLKECIGKRMSRDFAEFICCYWWYHIGGEEPSKNPWFRHPCEEETYPDAQQMGCQMCCNFQRCICQVYNFATPVGESLAQCGIFQQNCYGRCVGGCPLIWRRR